MTLGGNPSFNAVCHFGEGFNHRTRKAESQVAHKRVIYTQGVGDGDSGAVLCVGAVGQKDLRPRLPRVLYQITGNKMPLIFLTHAGAISPPCKKPGRCTWHLHMEIKYLGLFGAGNPALGTTVPPQSRGRWMEWAGQLARAGPEQSPTPS